MPFLNENDLNKKLKSSEIDNLYFFYGKDIATIEKYVKKMQKKFCDDDDMNYHFFNGKNLNLSDFFDCCEMLPMFAEWVVIAVNDFNAEDLNAKDFDFLKSILTNLPSTTVVIFYATSVNLFTAKKSLTAKNKKLSDLISKGGISCEFNYKSASELSKYIISKAQKFDCTFTKKSAEYLANRCLCNTMMVDNEVKKLCDYKISGEISELDIDLLVAKAIDTNAFLLAKSLIKGDGKLTFQILDELFDSQAEPIVILSALSMAFIDLYRAKVAVNEGISQSYVVSDFSYRGREFAVKNAFFDCKNMPVERLRRCIKILSDCDIALKSLRTNNRLLLETTIVKMMIR